MRQSAEGVVWTPISDSRSWDASINGEAEVRGRAAAAVPDAPSGCVVDIQRYAVHDGPGIRTVVFLKGCPLRCAWCHNPDAMDPRPQIAFTAARCIGCGACLDVCPRDAIRLGDDRRIDRDRCDGCMLCVDECMAAALSQVGETYTVDRLLAQVLRDLPFYEESGGGVTLSGGEPLLQHRFTAAFLAAAKGAGLHTVIETCGHARWAHMEAVLPDVDLVYFDLKLLNAARHREWTGIGNALILANARRIVAAHPGVVFRCPLVPGSTASDENVAALIDLLSELRQRSVHLLPYHNLGEGKLARVESSLRPLGLAPLPREITQHIADRFEAAGIHAVIGGSA
jgi:pyruvate formate lyase activating enzyme